MTADEQVGQTVTSPSAKMSHKIIAGPQLAIIPRKSGVAPTTRAEDLNAPSRTCDNSPGLLGIPAVRDAATEVPATPLPLSPAPEDTHPSIPLYYAADDETIPLNHADDDETPSQASPAPDDPLPSSPHYIHPDHDPLSPAQDPRRVASPCDADPLGGTFGAENRDVCSPTAAALKAAPAVALSTPTGRTEVEGPAPCETAEPQHPDFDPPSLPLEVVMAQEREVAAAKRQKRSEAAIRGQVTKLQRAAEAAAAEEAQRAAQAAAAEEAVRTAMGSEASDDEAEWRADGRDGYSMGIDHFDSTSTAGGSSGRAAGRARAREKKLAKQVKQSEWAAKAQETRKKNKALAAATANSVAASEGIDPPTTRVSRYNVGTRPKRMPQRYDADKQPYNASNNKPEATVEAGSATVEGSAAIPEVREPSPSAGARRYNVGKRQRHLPERYNTDRQPYDKKYVCYVNQGSKLTLALIQRQTETHRERSVSVSAHDRIRIADPTQRAEQLETRSQALKSRAFRTSN